MQYFIKNYKMYKLISDGYKNNDVILKNMLYPQCYTMSDELHFYVYQNCILVSFSENW